MPARPRANPQRMFTALQAQRADLGQPPWTGPAEASRAGRALVLAVLDALDSRLDAEAQPAALRGAVTYLLGLLAAARPGRAVEVRVPPYAAIQCVVGPGTPAAPRRMSWKPTR